MFQMKSHQTFDRGCEQYLRLRQLYTNATLIKYAAAVVRGRLYLRECADPLNFSLTGNFLFLLKTSIKR